MLAFLPTLGFCEMFLLVVLALSLHVDELVRGVDAMVRAIAGWVHGTLL